MKVKKKTFLFHVGFDEIERLEFTGTRLANGNIRAFNPEAIFEDWPVTIRISNQTFQLEESDDRDDMASPTRAPKGSKVSQAWYVPK